MFGFLKATPTTYVILYRDGRVVREGAGLSFWYYTRTATVVQLPLASKDVPFAFELQTADYQTLNVQGQLTYRISEPKKLAASMDFSVSRSGRYLSNDPEKLDDRLIATAQVLISAQANQMRLRDALRAYDQISRDTLAAMRARENIVLLGVEIQGLSVLAINPAPEVGKALEAQTREQLQQQSDEAVYARRNAAVEQERRIKESELATEIAVEEKKRIKRETQMNADIAVEEARAKLVERKAANDRKEAESQAYAVEAMLKPVKELDWRTLLAINSAKLDARQNLAIAFRDLAENAAKIGTLNITPDLLSSLTDDRPAAKR